jgi:DNA mismatch repair protein MutL
MLYFLYFSFNLFTLYIYMPSKIRILQDHTINKIAAGEVIENPASVVKELVENAIDAGSTDICVEIKEGGRQLIRVIDNGEGMSSDDALLCLERHATSKIREVEDIYSLATMGFRGEAIPSIAAISKFTLLTCQRKEEKNQEGTLIKVEGGQLLSHGPAVRSYGTTVEVKSLFFNVPVRKKFQKSPTYDAQEILKILTVLSLGHPAIKFELISDQKSVLMAPYPPNDQPSQQLSQRIEMVLGQDFLASAIPLSFCREPYHLKGYIGFPTQHRPNRTGQYLFINQRPVYSPFITFAIKEGYGTALPAQRHPVFVLHLEMPGNLLDVNVHPQKKEVRLRQEHLLKESLIQAVQTALQTHGFEENPEPAFPPFPSSFSYEALLGKEEDPFPPLPLKETAPSFFMSEKPFSPSFSFPSLQVKEEPASFDWMTKKQQPRILLTLPDFIVADPSSLDLALFSSVLGHKREGLCLINQKAAHARVCYESLLKQKENPAMQPLLIPINLEFSKAEAALLKDYLPILNNMGFEMQELGEHSFIISAFPHVLEGQDLQSCLEALVHHLSEWQDHRYLEKEKERQIALAASRLSVSTTKCLVFQEAQSLIEQLQSCEIPYHCPWGKPTLLLLSPENISHLFESKETL